MGRSLCPFSHDITSTTTEVVQFGASMDHLAGGGGGADVGVVVAGVDGGGSWC